MLLRNLNTFVKRVLFINGAESLSRGPWNNGAGVPLCRRKPLDKDSRIILFERKGATAPFPASGEDGSGQSPAKGSRDWSLAGS